MALKDTYKLIEDNLKTQILNASLGQNGLVIDRQIVDGKTNPPYLHVFFDTEAVNHETMCNREEWHIPIVVMAIAASYQTEDARQAKNLALDVSSALIADRTLNGAIRDMYRRSFEPNLEREIDSKKLFGSAVNLELIFINKED